VLRSFREQHQRFCCRLFHPPVACIPLGVHCHAPCPGLRKRLLCHRRCPAHNPLLAFYVDVLTLTAAGDTAISLRHPPRTKPNPVPHTRCSLATSPQPVRPWTRDSSAATATAKNSAAARARHVNRNSPKQLNVYAQLRISRGGRSLPKSRESALRVDDIPLTWLTPERPTICSENDEGPRNWGLHGGRYWD